LIDIKKPIVTLSPCPEVLPTPMFSEFVKEITKELEAKESRTELEVQTNS
jgi:hypothetical protein